MRTRYLNMFIGTLCVSFTLIILLFSVMSLATDFVGPTQPRAVFLLLVMCTVISAWTTWLRSRQWKSSFAFYMLCYAGCVTTVLCIGAATRFVPLSASDLVLDLVVLGMITAVFGGTASFAGMLQRSSAARLNARLQRMQEARKSMHDEETDQ